MLNSVKLRTKPSALALASVLALAAGCGQGQTPSASPTSTISKTTAPPMEKVYPPPATPPNASIKENQISPLSSIWYNFETKSFNTTSPSEHPRTLTTISSENSLEHTLSVHSIVTPAMIIAREFAGYDAEGLPTEELPPRECVENQHSPCKFTVGISSTEISLTQRETAVFTTIEVYYNIPEIGLDQPYDIVTYGFHT